MNRYDEWQIAHLRRVFSHYDVDCVFDVGANEGQYARMLRDKVRFKGLIISFEPNPDLSAKLRRGARNDPAWLIEDVAVGPQDGTSSFNVMKRHTFSSLSTPRHDETDLFTKMNSVVKQVEVRTERLSTTVERIRAAHGFQRPFLKMDTQGFDVQIVQGAPDTAREFIGLQSELAVKKLYEDSMDFRDAITVYEQCGFELSAFVPNTAGHFPRLIELDCIMLRSDLMEQPLHH